MRFFIFIFLAPRLSLSTYAAVEAVGSGRVVKWAKAVGLVTLYLPILTQASATYTPSEGCP